MGNALLNTDKEIIYLPVDRVTPNPYQPRKFFRKESIEELARSIKEYGVMQPISVRLINGVSYELVAGERRLRATRLAGLSTIPAIVVNIKDQDSAMIAMIENIQRENLNFIEEAEGFQNLIEDYSFTQEELAKRMGKSQSTIANKVRILRLSKKVQKFIIENDLSERHARALLKIVDEDLQMDVLQKVVQQGLTVKKTEELVEKVLGQTKEVSEEVKRDIKVKRLVKDFRLFSNSIKQSIDIMKESGFGTEYIMDEIDGGYEILITISYPEDSEQQKPQNIQLSNKS